MWPDHQNYGAINPGTTYGLDLSERNGFGVGSDFSPAQVNMQAARAAQATPSVWWLVAVIVIVAVLK